MDIKIDNTYFVEEKELLFTTKFNVLNFYSKLRILFYHYCL